MGTVLPRAALGQGRRGRGKDIAGTGIPSSGWDWGCAGGTGRAAGGRELVGKDVLDSSDLCKRAVGPVGLGMLCACRQRSPALCHPAEKLLLGENVVVLFLLLLVPSGLLGPKICAAT